MMLTVFRHWLGMQGKRLVFVTNNSTKSRKQYGKKFESLGLSVTEVDALCPNDSCVSIKKPKDPELVFFGCLD